MRKARECEAVKSEAPKTKVRTRNTKKAEAIPTKASGTYAKFAVRQKVDVLALKGFAPERPEETDVGLLLERELQDRGDTEPAGVAPTGLSAAGDMCPFNDETSEEEDGGAYEDDENLSVSSSNRYLQENGDEEAWESEDELFPASHDVTSRSHGRTLKACRTESIYESYFQISEECYLSD